jgi:hypothetical protein
MTDRPTADDQPDTDAIGRRIREAALSVDAPPQLRSRLNEARPAAGEGRGQGRAGRRGTRWRGPVAAAGVAAVTALVLLVVGVFGGGGASGPSFDDAAQLALARPTAPAPAAAGDRTTVQVAVGGISFPNYAYAWPRWRAAGTRHDRIDGRDVVTVTYRGPRGDVGYTIVDGKPLDEPAGARHITSGGQRLAIVKRGGTTFVTWRRQGHTCVLASRAPGSEQQLVRFATWA